EQLLGELREDRRSERTRAARVARVYAVGSERDGLRHAAGRASAAEHDADQGVRRLLQDVARTGQGAGDELMSSNRRTFVRQSALLLAGIQASPWLRIA